MAADGGCEKDMVHRISLDNLYLIRETSAKGQFRQAKNAGSIQYG